MWEDDVLLLSPQCPATWGLPAGAPHDANVLRLADLLLVAEDAWNTLVVRLLLSYELGLQGDAATARDQLEQCRYVLRGVVADPGGLVRRTRPALRHVVRAALQHLDITASTSSTASSDNAAPTEDLLQLDRRQMAAVWGLRASAMRLYGCDGWQAAHDCAERAVALDMEEPAWLHLLGLHRRDHALLKEVVACRPGAALHWAASILRGQGRAGGGAAKPGALRGALLAVSEVADGRPGCAMTQTQAALLLRLGATLLRREGPGQKHAAEHAKAVQRAEACARRALLLAPQCVLVQTAAAVVLGATPQQQHREALHRLYGVEWSKAIAMLQEYSFGLVYLMTRPE